MAKPSTVTEPPKPLNSGALLAASQACCRYRPKPVKSFRQDHENQQILALPRIGKNQEVEEQDGAAEQRQHDRRDDREVIGGV